jgi:hypothetical protein
MSTDNTLKSPVLGDSGSMGLIELVREGMRVVDAAGEELGKVELVRMGDPAAATIDTPPPQREGFLSDIAEAFGGEGEPDLPEPLRSQMLRTGFVKIDGKGWIDTDRYVSPEYIAGVNEDTVTLSIAREEILPAD